jgi:hypothetical protein
LSVLLIYLQRHLSKRVKGNLLAERRLSVPFIKTPATSRREWSRTALECLRHTPFECPRRRYSVLREAPEKRSEDNDRRRRPAPQGLTAPRSSLTSRVGSSGVYERGTGH